MAKLDGADRYHNLLGHLIADRVGIDPNTIPRDNGITAEQITPGRMLVQVTTMHFVPVDDYRELEALAHERFMANEPAGLYTA